MTSDGMLHCGRARRARIDHRGAAPFMRRKRRLCPPANSAPRRLGNRGGGKINLTVIYEAAKHMPLQYMATPVLDRELKKGSAELLILSLVEDRPRHGYDIGQLIELRSRGALRFNVASLYPLLYRLEKRGWIRGRWVEKAGQRRRRY